MEIKEIMQEQAWEIRHLVMWPSKSLDFIKLEDDATGRHFGLFDDDGLATVVSCFTHDNKMQFRKLATLEAKQQKGYGSFLLNFIIELGKKENVSALWCNARLNKKSFYEKFGMHEINERFEKDGIAFTIMELKYF